MLLTITTTHSPATDLGYLLHKHPSGVQSFDLTFGQGPRLLPGGAEERCTAACCWTSTRLAWSAGKGPKATRRLGPVRQRPPVRRLVVPQRGDRPGLRLRARRAAARTGPELAETAIPLRPVSPVAAVRGRRGVAAPAVRAAGLRGRGRRASARRAVPGVGRQPLLRRRPRSDEPAARPADAPLRADPGLRRRQALLGRRRRGREAAAPRRRAGWPAIPSGSRSPAATCSHRPAAHADRPSRAARGRGARPRRRPRSADGREEEAVEKPLSLNEQRLGAVARSAQGEPAPGRVLDLGCGEGQALRHSEGHRSSRRSSAWTSRTARWRLPRGG